MEIITKSRWAVDQPPPEGDEKLAMLAAWCEVLEVIPVEELNAAYVATAQAKTNGFPVNAMDIIAHWNKNQATERMIKALAWLREPQ